MTERGEKQSREIRRRVIEALKGTFDPEIPVNVYDLGLVYRIDVDEEGNVEVDMTMTAPGCPVAGRVIAMAEAAIREA
ncbi:MAG: iron-sulfur cluster assembly protein, partial [Candidatus Korarchaeota archaeon]|nr:iron-sulfur cluster assembly protein [Candidatus Korarchaeota archaeon]